MPKKTQRERLLELMQKRPLLRSHELDPLGIPRAVLQRLLADGEVQRVARGLYVLPGVEASADHTLAQAQTRVPHGVICLLSALRFHDLTTQNPFEVWMAIDRKARRPEVDYPPLRIVRFSGAALHQGVDEYDIDEVSVRITSPARTVADCFKYRNKIGIDIAIEALRDFRRQKAGTMDDLWKAAELDRVSRIMKPYVEALSG